MHLKRLNNLLAAILGAFALSPLAMHGEGESNPDLRQEQERSYRPHLVHGEDDRK